MAKKQGWAERLGLTPEQLKELASAAWGTWEYIGADVLSACEAEGESAVMSRDAVVEVVMDANYIESNNPQLSKEVKTLLRDYTKSAAVAAYLKAEVFKHSRYGW